MPNLLFSSLVFNINIYTSIILYVALYWIGTQSLTLREEGMLRVFENSVLNIIFGPTRDKVTGKRIKLHNEELNDVNTPTNIIRVIKWRWSLHVAGMGW